MKEKLNRETDRQAR